MNPLDEPMTKYIPDGYRVCSSSKCRQYEHHEFVLCWRCGKPMTREKRMTWREFIAEQVGAGPLNTFYGYLRKLEGGDRDYWDPLKEPYASIYREAEEIYKRRQAKYDEKKGRSYYPSFWEPYKKNARIGKWKVQGSTLRYYLDHVIYRYYASQRTKVPVPMEVIRNLEWERSEMHHQLLAQAGFTRDDPSEEHSAFELALQRFVQRKSEEVGRVRDNATEEDLYGLRGDATPTIPAATKLELKSVS